MVVTSRPNIDDDVDLDLSPVVAFSRGSQRKIGRRPTSMVGSTSYVAVNLNAPGQRSGTIRSTSMITNAMSRTCDESSVVDVHGNGHEAASGAGACERRASPSGARGRTTGERMRGSPTGSAECLRAARFHVGDTSRTAGDQGRGTPGAHMPAPGLPSRAAGPDDAGSADRVSRAGRSATLRGHAGVPAR
jgi:hypothetical protein